MLVKVFGSMIRDLDMLFRLYEETGGSVSADQASCVSPQGNFVSERALANCEFRSNTNHCAMPCTVSRTGALRGRVTGRHRTDVSDAHVVEMEAESQFDDVRPWRRADVDQARLQV